METLDRRKHERINHYFQTKLTKVGLYFPSQGVTENLSAMGAFIKTENRHSFQVDDRLLVTFFLPPDFAGQHKPIGLQGTAVVTRLDSLNNGIAIQFTKMLKQFDRIRET